MTNKFAGGIFLQALIWTEPALLSVFHFRQRSLAGVVQVGGHQAPVCSPD